MQVSIGQLFAKNWPAERDDSGRFRKRAPITQVEDACTFEASAVAGRINIIAGPAPFPQCAFACRSMRRLGIALGAG